MDIWEKLRKILGNPSDEEQQIVNLLKESDEPTREEIFDELKYSKGGEYVERIYCRLQEIG